MWCVCILFAKPFCTLLGVASLNGVLVRPKKFLPSPLFIFSLFRVPPWNYFLCRLSIQSSKSFEKRSEKVLSRRTRKIGAWNVIIRGQNVPPGARLRLRTSLLWKRRICVIFYIKKKICTRYTCTYFNIYIIYIICYIYLSSFVRITGVRRR